MYLFCVKNCVGGGMQQRMKEMTVTFLENDLLEGRGTNSNSSQVSNCYEELFNYLSPPGYCEWELNGRICKVL
jgi:hypothetical protein